MQLRGQSKRFGIAAIEFAAALLCLFAFEAGIGPARAQDLPIDKVALFQYLLVWTGDYIGMVDGVIGPQTEAAFQQYWGRRFGRAPQVVTPEQIDALIRDADAASVNFDFVLERDRSIGVTFGLPRALFDTDEPTARANSTQRIFRSSDQAIELELAYHHGRFVSLDELYRRLTNLKGRNLAYTVFQPSWFVVSGTRGDREFYLRYHGSGREIRGFAFSYPRERHQHLQPVVIAMSNVFRASATATDDLIDFLEEVQRGPLPAVPKAPTEPPATTAERNDSSGSGFVIDTAGHVLTNAHVVTGCDEIVLGVGERVELVASDQTNDLALLQRSASDRPTPLVFRSDGVRLGEEVVAAGFPLHGILADSINITVGVVSSLSGLRNDSRFLQTTAQVQPGNSGGPLLDRGGMVIGIVSGKLDAVSAAEKAGFIPEGVNFAIRHDAIRPFLEGHDVKFEARPREATAKSVEEIADLVRRSVVAITCRAGRSQAAAEAN